MKSLKLPIFALGLGVATLGCDSQVGPEFEGESLLSLGGELVLNENSRDLVPALAFWLRKTEEIAIVDVEVSGSFPANFRLDVLTPPPEGALVDPNGLGFSAIGSIVVVPKDHPATYPMSSLAAHGYGLSCGQDVCELERHACVGESCFEQDLECKPFDPCQVLEETGDPNLATDPSAQRSTVYSEDASDHHIVMERTCVDSGACYEVAKRCPLDPPYTSIDDYYPTEVTNCKVIAERGDRALAKPSSLDDAVEGYAIFYAPRPVTLVFIDSLSHTDLEQGYNLVRLVDAADDKTWLANIRCQEAAEQRAKLELDSRHGTMTAGTDGRAYLGLGDAEQRELEELMLAEAKDCPPGVRIETVANPEAAGLKLRMGPRSSSGPF
jgi:hypothetical protein